MLVDIDIIMRVFIKKNLHKYGERLQCKVPMQALWEFSPFFAFSLGEEL